MGAAERYRPERVGRQADQEQVEVLVVSFSDACADPGAVVVEPFDAVVAEVAVGRARRPEDLASRAVSHSIVQSEMHDAVHDLVELQVLVAAGEHGVSARYYSRVPRGNE